MATRWEKLSGDTSVFAFKVSFAPDPDDGQGIDADQALSWGGFQIWVEGKNLCAHLEEGERIDSVHWYLLPMLEWLASNWNPLLHEERLPLKNKADAAWESLQLTRFPPPALEAEPEEEDWDRTWHSWWTRHALRASRQGGLFPDVVLRRWRDQVEISWGPIKGTGTPEHFQFMESEKGYVRVSPKVVAEALHDVLQSAARYLAERAPESDRMKALHRLVVDAGSAGRHADQRLMWLAGLGVDENTVRQGWRRLKGYFRAFAEDERAALLGADRTELVIEGSCHAALMFGSVSPDVKKADALVLADRMVDLYDPEGDPEVLRGIVRTEPLSRSIVPPWEQGYALAEEVLAHGNLIAGEQNVDVEKLVAFLQLRVDEIELTDRSIRGVSIAGPGHRPGILVNRLHQANRYPSGRRFSLAHELCHILFDRELGQRLAVASGPWAPRDIERRANAFAAMLLMPLGLVKVAVAAASGPLDTTEGVEQVARHLNTGFRSTLWHLTNLGFIDEVTQQRISSETTEAVAQQEH